MSIHTYPVICCDEYGEAKRASKLHMATTDEDGAALEGTCPVLFARGSWFVFADEDEQHARERCKRCLPEGGK